MCQFKKVSTPDLLNFNCKMKFLLLLVVPYLVVSQEEEMLPGVPGVPGQDYPVLSATLSTSFDCNDGFIEGYYAHAEVIYLLWVTRALLFIGPGVLTCATRGGGRSEAGHCFSSC